jgi:hypothetical protein
VKFYQSSQIFVFRESEYDIEEYVALWDASSVNIDHFTQNFEVNIITHTLSLFFSSLISFLILFMKNLSKKHIVFVSFWF